MKSGFEEVMPLTIRLPALVLQTFSVPVALEPAQAGAKNGGDGTWISGIATFLKVSRHAPRPRVPRIEIDVPGRRIVIEVGVDTGAEYAAFPTRLAYLDR